MVDLATTLLHGPLICIPFTAFVLITFRINPRLWLHSLPKDISNMAPPKTELETHQTKAILLPIFLMILPGLSVLSVFYISQEIEDLSFLAIFVHLYLMWAIVHIWDFLIIDCGYCFMIDPSNPPIDGTHNAKGWKDYKFHLFSLRKALLGTLVFVAPAAGILAYFL